MSVEAEEISALVRRACAVDGGTGEPVRGYIAIYGGANSKNARKLVAPVPIGADVDSIIDAVLRRVSTAKAEGVKKLFVRLYETGESAPADVVVLDGDANAKDPNEIEGEGGSLAGAHADVVRGAYNMISRLVDKNFELFGEYAEFRAQAAAAYQELKVREEVGFAGNLAAIAEGLGPTVEKALPEALRVYYAHQRLETARLQAAGEEQSGPALTAEDRARRACAALERQVLETAVELGNLEMTEALRMEVGGRLTGMIQAAQQGLAEALKPRPKAEEPDAEEEGGEE